MRSLPGSLPLTEAQDELIMRPLLLKTGSVSRQAFENY